MKFFVDSADLDLVKPLLKSGGFGGVTTNPTLLKAANFPLTRESVADFVDAVVGCGAQEVFFQSWGETASELYERGKELSKDHPALVVKLPCTREGLEAAAGLAKDKIKTCITAIYAEHQSLLASAVGAAYAAPYLGRMNDAGLEGHALIARMAAALRGQESKTKILAASVRSVEDITQLAQNGVSHVTLAPKVAGLLFEERLTLEAAARFEADAGRVTP
jgi:transaldolase